MDKKRIITIVVAVIIVATLGTGVFFAVRYLTREGAPEIVLTEDFEKDEIFRINTLGCKLSEARVYMRASEDKYSNAFGSEIWSKDLGGVTLEDELKSTTLARLAQIKAMTLLAEDRAVLLSDEEKELAKKAADKYISGLSAETKSALQIDEAVIEKMYSEYALANKVYIDVTKDINPEISDDEARTISVKHILIKTNTTDADGNTREFTDAEKQSAYKRAEEVLQKIAGGADFDSMIEKYSEDSENQYTFGKGTMPENFEKAAFNLDSDEVSGIVETEYGYHIIKCVSTFDREETDNNKTRIVIQRKKEAFNKVYDEFVKTLHTNLNDELWENAEFAASDNTDASTFFDIYNEVFAKSE